MPWHLPGRASLSGCCRRRGSPPGSRGTRSWGRASPSCTSSSRSPFPRAPPCVPPSAGEGEQDLRDLAGRRDHRVVARLQLVERPFPVVAQSPGELIEGARRWAPAVDVRSLQLLAGDRLEGLLEGPERLGHEPSLEPLGVALAR